jgi:hypothetical protein
MIDNKDIKLIIKKVPYLLPVGSYARDSHELKYKDGDFITLSDLDFIVDELKKYFDVEILKDGQLYKSLLVNNKTVDIWKTTEKNFYQDYLIRYLPKHKVINLYKYLQNY